jgi:hypothetical protein
MITYPTGQVLGVVDDPDRASTAAAALAAAGFGARDVRVLAGPEGGEELARLGPPPNPLSRIVRVFQFLLMDQTPDFLIYERAIGKGRAVVAVHVAGRDRMEAARAVLEGHGAHFLNHYGRFATEELSMWRGEEIDLPDALRR